MSLIKKSVWPKNLDERVSLIAQILTDNGVSASVRKHRCNGFIFTLIEGKKEIEYWARHSTLYGDRTLVELFTRFGGDDTRDMLSVYADGHKPLLMTIENEKNSKKFVDALTRIFKHDVQVLKPHPEFHVKDAHIS